MKKSFKKGLKNLIVSKVSKNEIKYVETLAKVLAKRKDKSKALTNRELQVILQDKHKVVFCESSIRRYINYIRVKRLLENLISGSNGYYVAQTTEEVAAYVHKLQHRVYAIYSVIESYDI